MKWLAGFVLASVAVTSGVAQTPSAAQSAPAQLSAADETAIMRVVIDWIVQPANNANGPVGTAGPVLVTQAVARCDVTPMSPARDCLAGDMVEGFLGDRNATKYASIPERVRTGFLALHKDPRALPNPERPGLILISQETHSEIGKAGLGFWEVLRRRYPGVVGRLVQLGRREGGWHIVRVISLWIS